jgi:transposase-like protein
LSRWDIEHHLARTLHVELSRETISNITDAVCDEVTAWQARPLDPVYPVVFFDALVVKVRDNNVVTNKAAHIAIGVDTDGIKHVLGIWVQTSEGASFWAQACAEMANRGVKDIIIACCDGLTGLPEAIEAIFPFTVVQTCVVPAPARRTAASPPANAQPPASSSKAAPSKAGTPPSTPSPRPTPAASTRHTDQHQLTQSSVSYAE